MPIALIAIIQGIIAAAPAAQQLWAALQPILQRGTDPTPEEWAELNTLADEAHARVQSDRHQHRAALRISRPSRPDMG